MIIRIIMVLKMKTTRTFKGQSAMEYLMTYGWAILIIAIVLAALFSLGVFSGTLPTACIAQSGFTCQQVVYSHGTGVFPGGNIIAIVGQNTGTNWGQANIIFLNSTNLANFQNSGNFLFTGNILPPPTNSLGVMNSGVATTVYIPVSGNSIAATPIGTSISGQIWARYVIGGSTYYAELAALTAKAV